MHEFIRYMSLIAEDKNLPSVYKFPDSIIIKGKNDRALEICCDESTILLYYFLRWSDRAIHYCNEDDLHDPNSLDWVMEWIDKLNED